MPNWNDIEYRKSRAEWLKNKLGDIPKQSMKEWSDKCDLIDQAFEIGEKECTCKVEHVWSKDICNICKKPITPTPKALPEKLKNYEECSHNDFKRIINEILEWLANNKGER